MLPKVIVIGFNKCATRSIAQLFAAAGHRTVHHKIRARLRPSRSLARLLRENLAAGRKALAGAEDFVLYADLIHLTQGAVYEGNSAFAAIAADYPDARFILNTRDRDAWIRSRLRHGHGEFARRYMAATGLPDLAALSARWCDDWAAHHAAVRAFFADTPERLVTFDIDRDGPQVLVAAFAEYGLNAKDWADTGRSRDRALSPLRARLKRWWAHLRPRSGR